jgi:hypothetical protein
VDKLDPDADTYKACESNIPFTTAISLEFPSLTGDESDIHSVCAMHCASLEEDSSHTCIQREDNGLA